MSKYSVKHGIGKQVSVQGINGRVTAVTIRGKGRQYEFSFLGDSGPTSIWAEECEIEDVNDNRLGFRKTE